MDFIGKGVFKPHQNWFEQSKILKKIYHEKESNFISDFCRNSWL